MSRFSTNHKDIGLRVREARTNAGFTQAQLAEMVDISNPQHISAIECGAKSFSLETFMGICNVLGVSADFLLFGRDNSEDDNCMPDLSVRIARMAPEVQALAEESINVITRAYYSRANVTNLIDD